MKRAALWIVGALAWGGLTAAEPVFSQDFSNSKIGELPDDIMLYDGGFTVKEESANRFLELPGAPLDSYSVLFGPHEAHGVEVSGRIYATKTGRKFPVFGLGLNGLSGYRLQVSPAKGALEIVHGDVVIASVPFTWKSAEWTELRLVVRKIADSEFRVEGKAWTAGTEAPKDELITFTGKKLHPAGKSTAWGMPFSGTPIRYDDLKVTRLGGS